MVFDRMSGGLREWWRNCIAHLLETLIVTNLTNETIGNYRVVKGLGEGSMGSVCLAQHPVIGRKVAIKLLRPDLSEYPDVVARFFNEARAIHAVGHENVVEVLDFGQTDKGQPYFIMEFLEGESLSEAIGRGPMDPAQAVIIGNQLCGALSAAHAKGIVHRDLKPQNIQLVAKPDGGLHVKVLDFGVAKLLDSLGGAHSARTRTGSVMGTPLYMAPEQCRGAGAVDYRADIYSLGVVLFEMLVGRPPFVAEGLGDLLTMHMFHEPPRLHDELPQLPEHLAAAVMKALAKEPGDRFQSMDEFRDALAGELELLVNRSTGASEGVFEAHAETTRPSPTWKISALVGMLSVVAALGLGAASRSSGAAMAPASPPPSVAAPSKRRSEIVAPVLPGVRPAALPAPPLPNEVKTVRAAKRASARSRVRRVDPVIGEDGLATPSF